LLIKKRSRLGQDHSGQNAATLINDLRVYIVPNYRKENPFVKIIRSNPQSLFEKNRQNHNFNLAPQKASRFQLIIDFPPLKPW
jgi:hypothetical protein